MEFVKTDPRIVAMSVFGLMPAIAAWSIVLKPKDERFWFLDPLLGGDLRFSWVVVL